MLYPTNKGNITPLSIIESYLKQIKYFTVNKEGIFTCDENGENPYFKGIQLSDKIEYQDHLKSYKIKEFTSKKAFLCPEVSIEHKNGCFYRILLYEFNDYTKEILLNNAYNITFNVVIPKDLFFFNSQG